MRSKKTFLCVSPAKIKGFVDVLKKVSCAQPLTALIILTSSATKGHKSNMKKMIAKIAASATIAIAVTGCYIGRANFEGENMHLYPLWHTTDNAQTSSTTPSGVVENLSK